MALDVLHRMTLWNVEPMSQLSDLARFLVLRREALLTEWLDTVERLPRRRESDLPVTREAGAQLVDQIIQTIESSTVTETPIGARR